MSSLPSIAQPGTPSAGQQKLDGRHGAINTSQHSVERHDLLVGPTQTAGPAESHAARLQTGQAQFYDTDADSLGSELISEEDVLYSDGEDDRNEIWAQQQRQGRHSDALLSCPGQPLDLPCAADDVGLLEGKPALVSQIAAGWTPAALATRRCHGCPSHKQLHSKLLLVVQRTAHPVPFRVSAGCKHTAELPWSLC